MAKAMRKPASRMVLVVSPSCAPCAMRSRMRNVSDPLWSAASTPVATMLTSISSDPTMV